MSSLSACSPGDGTTPTSSARNRRNSSYARSDSTGRPARASASINSARSRSRNGSTAIWASSSPMTSSGRPNSKSAAARSSIAGRAAPPVEQPPRWRTPHSRTRRRATLATTRAPRRTRRARPPLGQTPRARPAPAPRTRNASTSLLATRSRYPGAACLQAVVTQRLAQPRHQSRSVCVALGGGPSPHRTSTRRSLGTTSLAWTTNTASTWRCWALPRRTCSPSRTTSNGPSTHSVVATRSSTDPPTHPAGQNVARQRASILPNLWPRAHFPHLGPWNRLPHTQRIGGERDGHPSPSIALAIGSCKL